MGRERLPVIVSLGGVNGAGRASGHHDVARMAYEAMPAESRRRSLAALAGLMGLENPSASDRIRHRPP